MTPASPNHPSTKTRVRLATEADLAAMVRLRAAWTYEYTGREPAITPDEAYVTAFRRWWAAERDRRVTWLGGADGVPVGMLNMAVFTRMPSPGRDPSRWGYVANVFVLAEHRGAGLGRALLDAAIAHAEDHGFARLVLSPSPRSVPFYQRAGFHTATSLMVRPGAHA